MDLVDALSPLDCCPHFVMVVGKGGVGKTTVSILLAMELGSRGKTVLLSLDPARHLSRYLKLAGETGEIDRGIHVRQVSVEREVERIASQYADFLRELMPSLSVLNLDSAVDALKYSPGVEEEVLLRKLEEALTSGYDYVVVDTPPTGVTLRTLALPRLYMVWLGKLIEVRERIVSLRYVIARTLGRKAEVRDRALLKLYEMRSRFEALERALSSESRTSYVIVATPEPLPMHELRESVGFLKSRLGVRPKLLVLNKVLPEGLAAALGQLDAQRGFLEELRSYGASYALVEYLGRPTESISDIRELRNKVRVWRP